MSRWRQCVASALATGQTAKSNIVVCGPLRAGGMIRRIEWWFGASSPVYADVNFFVSASDQRTVANLLASEPIITRSGYRTVDGWLGYRERLIYYQYAPRSMEVARLVDSGARFLLGVVRHSEAATSFGWVSVSVEGQDE